MKLAAEHELSETGNDAEILNCGLALAMEWEEQWPEPIHNRLPPHFSRLTSMELEHYNHVCRKTMKYGHALAYSLAELESENVIKQEWQSRLLARYPWVSIANQARLFSQGMDHAGHDGKMRSGVISG